MPKPHFNTIVEDVYAEVPAHLRAQLESLRAHVQQYPDAYPSAAEA